MALGLACVLLAAVLEGGGTTAQALGAARSGARSIMLQPAYLFGWVLDALGWALSLVAMRYLPLLVVQPVLATSLVVTVILNDRLLSIRPSRRSMTAIATVVVAVTVLTISAAQGEATNPPGWLALALGVCLVALVALTVRMFLVSRPVAAAIVSGLAYSLAAVATRGLHGRSSWGEIVQDPLAWLMLALSAVGALTYARALEVAGPHGVTSVTAWLWVVEIVVPSILGVEVLHDQIRPGWEVPALLALVVAIASTITLSLEAETVATRSMGEVDAA